MEGKSRLETSKQVFLKAGMIDLHLILVSPQLNIKGTLPKWFKMEVDEKFDQFYPYLKENWERMPKVNVVKKNG